jgi:phosphinothricin acetyltransferase
MAPPMTPIVRPCFEHDLQAVQFIYAHHVLHSTASFEIEAPSLDEMRARWIKTVGEGWPFLVATAENDPTRVLGFAYGGRYHTRPAYAHTFEDSIYVAPSLARRGVGTALLTSLLLDLRNIGARQVVALIGDSANVASVALHKKLRFRQVGVLEGVGEKFGREVDVVLMQRRLA